MSKLSGRAQWNTANAKLANKPFENLFDDPSRVCVRCERPYTNANKVYTRLYGVMCVCGSQEWKAVEQRMQSDVCPVCGGDGIQNSGVRGQRPCIACDGTGKRS
jgi:hypothetical protein